MRPQFAQTYVLLISVSPSLTFAAGQKSTLLVEHPQFWSDAECMSLIADTSWYWWRMEGCSVMFMPFFQVPSGRCFQTWSPDRARAICCGQRQVYVAVSSFNKLWGFAITKGDCTICFVSLCVIQHLWDYQLAFLSYRLSFGIFIRPWKLCLQIHRRCSRVWNIHCCWALVNWVG